MWGDAHHPRGSLSVHWAMMERPPGVEGGQQIPQGMAMGVRGQIGGLGVGTPPEESFGLMVKTQNRGVRRVRVESINELGEGCEIWWRSAVIGGWMMGRHSIQPTRSMPRLPVDRSGA